MAIGDGCIGSDLICGAVTQKYLSAETIFSGLFLYGHGQVSSFQFGEFMKACGPGFHSFVEALNKEFGLEAFVPDMFLTSGLNIRNSLNTKNTFELEELDTNGLAVRHLREAEPRLQSYEQLKYASGQCTDVYKALREQVGYFFAYNLYDECWGEKNTPLQANAKISSQPAGHHLPSFKPYPCGGSAVLEEYLSTPAVHKSLHLPPNARFVNADNGKGLDYKATIKNLIPLHKKVAEETDLRVLIYNGDTDPGLNSFFGEWWVNSLGLKVSEQWRPWTLDGGTEVAGYVPKFSSTSSKGSFDYLTIRGSGHMVPQMKPRAAFEMLKAWLHGNDYKPYVPV